MGTLESLKIPSCGTVYFIKADVDEIIIKKRLIVMVTLAYSSLVSRALRVEESAGLLLHQKCFIQNEDDKGFYRLLEQLICGQKGSNGPS